MKDLIKSSWELLVSTVMKYLIITVAIVAGIWLTVLFPWLILVGLVGLGIWYYKTHK